MLVKFVAKTNMFQLYRAIELLDQMEIQEVFHQWEEFLLNKNYQILKVDKIVNKHLDLNYTKEIVQYIKSLGMSVHGTFTYGLPGETKANMLETKKYISEVKFTTVQESGTAEIEGAPLYNLNKKDLSVYPAAKIDSEYTRHADGSKKWMDLVESLQNK